MRRHILDVKTADGSLKPITFYTVTALEFYLGVKQVAAFENRGFLPKTPYRKDDRWKSRLYTETQLKELRDLFENYYPVRYQGKDPVLKERYKKQLIEYSQLCRQLQDKWVREDYIEIEPATPKSLKKWRKDIATS